MPPKNPPRSLIRSSAAALAVAAALTGLAGPASADDAAFTSAADIPLGDTTITEGVAIGDFNSDGRHDLAITDNGRDRVIIRLGNGDGTFKDAPDLPKVTNPLRIATGDFNGDGVEDLAVAGKTAPDTGAAVFTGIGNGQFAESASFVLPGKAPARAASVGDFNSDGNEDLAIASTGNVSVRVGKGNGTFGTGPDIPFPQRGPQIALPGDYDSDGVEDLAVTLSGPNEIAMLRGNGNATFQAPKTVGIPNIGGPVASGDFNSDGRIDVAVNIPIEDKVSVRLGNGNGTFSDDPSDVAVGDNPGHVAVGDFDSDGREDLVVANRGDDNVSVRLGNGDGSFRDSPNVAAGDYAFATAVGDLNRDGKEDLAVANALGRSVSIRLGSGTPPLAGNLLVNGGFEQGFGARLPSQSPGVPGWTTTDGATFVRYGSLLERSVPTWLDSQRFATGGFHYLRGGESTQTVDVAASTQAIDDGRATARLSAYLGAAYDDVSLMKVTAEFLGAAGQPLGVLGIGPVTAADRANVTTLLRRAGSAAVPAGTRSVRVKVTSVFGAGTADNVKLTLDTTPAEPRPDRQDDDTPQPSRFGPDTKVTVGLASRSVGARGPIPVRVSNANGFAVSGTVSARTAIVTSSGRRKRATLRARGFTTPAAGRTTLKLALSKPLRRELKRRRKLSVQLAVVAKDPAGTSRTLRKRVIVRLKR